MKLEYIIKEKDNYKIINDVLTLEFSMSSRLRVKLIKNKKITLNGVFCDTRNSVKTGDIITINFDYEEESLNIEPTKINLDIVYEDEWLLILNKPAGMAIHPSILHYEDSLSNGVKYYFETIKLKKKIRPVNRLDFNTSGLVVFAKCEYIQECLIQQMSTHQFKKEYLALVDGKFEEKQGTIDLPIARKENSIIERCVNKHGQRSITHYMVLAEYSNYSLVKCLLETGRTHQIRVHMSAMGHPLLGDDLYGKTSCLISRQALHCYNLEFIHPVTKEQLKLICPLPDDLQNLCQKD